ncbi:hypothetical protein [Erythrobacter litoralis]|uniref:Inner membrane protein n=1 Tax=Erythrobacter litoralis (strain HTCC2594) TaxID=314225 RepID=Q2N8S0_ERYLH|nr:hypothetical protein [Erythrobacter litoralis]ABC63921.1 hypothetical protein ELI_09145 [Erythrobacter litoralis HTCC2594]
MNDFLTQSRQGGSFRAILGVALMILLIGAAVAGYLWWRPSFDSVAIEEETPQAQVADLDPEESLADITPAPSPSARASQAVQEATEAVERVAEQQGGLEQRLAAAEQRLTQLDLQAQAAAGNAARAEGLLIAFATRRAIERGAELGFLADQLRLRFGDALPNAVRTIISMSRDPVTMDQLIARLEGLEPQLRTVDEEPSLARLRRELSELFIVRRETAPSPQPVRRMERARLFLESGRYEAAIEEVQNMPGAPAAERWIADMRRYAAAQRALDLIETAAVLEPRRLRDGAGNRIGQPSPVQETVEQ